MSDYKAQYSDESEEYVKKVVPSSELDQARYDRSKLREQKHNESWIKQKVSLNEVVGKFTQESNRAVKQYNNGGVKFNFEGDRYIVKCDKVAGYLRIYDKKTKMYCKLDGTPSSNPDETHFKIKRREEM